jgi:hypothetical protein
VQAWPIPRGRGQYDLPVLATGPSRSADIEKTLVIPAHGPPLMIAVLCDRSVSPAALVAG